MPRLMVKHSVTVMRDGQRITPEIGKAFDFTDAEVADMDKAEPVPYRGRSRCHTALSSMRTRARKPR
jgi:hypothetical protein